MAITKNIRLSILADVSDYQKRMALIPGITEKQAGAAARKMERELVKAQIDSAKAARKAAADSSKAWGGVGSIIAGTLSADAIKGFASATAGMVANVFEARNEILQLSRTTGIATGTLAALSVGADKLGLDSGQITDSFRDFGEVLFDFAASGGTGGRAAEALKALKIETTDLTTGALRPADVVLREVLDKLPRMANATERAALAQQLFGDAGLDLIAILERQDLASLEADAERYGRTLDAEAIRNTEVWNASLAALTGTIGGFVAAWADFFMIADVLKLLTTGLVVFGSVAQTALDDTAERIALVRQATEAWASGDDDALRVIQNRFIELADESGSAFQRALDDGARFAREAEGLGKGVEATIKTEFLAEAARKKAAKEAADETRKRAAVEAKAASAREKASRAAAKAESDRAKEAIKARKEAEASIVSLNRLFAETASDTVTEERKIVAELQKRKDAIAEIEAVLGSSEATAEARRQAELRGLRDVVALSRERSRSEEDAAAEIQEMRQAAHEAELGRLAEEKQARADGLALQLAGLEQAASTSLEFAGVVAARRVRDAATELAEQDQVIEGLAQRRAELEQAISESTSKRQRQALRGELRGIKRQERAEGAAREQAASRSLKAWRGQQQAAAAQAAFQGGVAAIKAFALFGPPPSPPGIAAAAAAVALTAAQISMIASEKPPQFHTGFSGQGATFPSFTAGPDERAVIVRSTEPVLNQRAGDELGRENIAELNRTGTLPAGGGGGGIMELNFERRQIGAMVGGTVRAGGRLRTLLARVGGAGPAGRRPVFNR